MIEKPEFGFYITGTEGDSYVDIGFIKAESMRDESELIWIDNDKNDFWWTATISGIRF